MPPATKPSDKPVLPGLPGGTASPFSGPPPAIPGGLPGGPSSNLPGDAPDDDEEFSEDFTGVSASGFVFAEGTWALLCTGFEKTEKGEYGQWVWEFKFLNGPDAGKTISDFCSLSPNARWKIVRNLEAFGILASGTLARFKRKDLVGHAVMGEIFTDKYFSNKQNKEVEGSKIRELYPPTAEATELAKQAGSIPNLPADPF